MLKYIRNTVYPTATFWRKEPVNFKPENRAHFTSLLSYQCPRLDVYYFPDIHILPDATLFYGLWPLEWSFLLFRKRIKTHNIKGIWSIRTRWQKLILEKKEHPYLVIHDAWTKNYYHWITQALPRLLLALKVNSNFTLLLPEDHVAPFHLESLDLLGVKDILHLNADQRYYRVFGLLYPAHDIEVGSYHDTLMIELAKRVRRPRKEGAGIYLFVHRISASGRRITNEDHVLNTFVSFGFQIVSFENLRLDQQINLADNATVLAGVHGAGLTNMLFMPSGSKVLELTTRLQGDQYYYFTLSNALKHHYFYLFCESDNDLKTVQDADLIVDVLTLKNTLQLMLHPSQT